MIRRLSRLLSSRQPRARSFDFGAFQLPESDLTGHLLCAGALRSGKSLTLRTFMQSTFPFIGAEGQNSRAIVYDPKGDMLPILHAFCDPSRIFTLNPYHLDGVSLDCPGLVRELRHARDFITAVAPSNPSDSNPFFVDAVHDLGEGVIESWMRDGRNNWDLAELVHTMLHSEHLKEVVGKHAATSHLLAYFEEPKQWAGIRSTIVTKFGALKPIANAWTYADRTFSLQDDWINGNSILVLPALHDSVVMKSVIKLVLKKAFDAVLSLPDNDPTDPNPRRCYFVIDELAEAPKLDNDSLVHAAKLGPSKGLVLAIAFQSVAGLRHLYGKDLAAELLGQFGTKFFARVECPETSAWISSLFGQQVVERTKTSTSLNPNPSVQISCDRSTEHALLPIDAQTLPICSYETGGHWGLYLTRSGAFAGHIPAVDLFERFLIPPHPDVPQFVSRMEKWPRCQYEPKTPFPWQGESPPPPDDIDPPSYLDDFDPGDLFG